MAIQSFAEPIRVCEYSQMDQERTSPTLMGLPNELQERVADFLDRKGLVSSHSSCKHLRKITDIPFYKIFFLKRCHAISHHSMVALIDILRNPILGSHVETIAFNLVTLATDVMTQGNNWTLTQSGIPEPLPATVRYWTLDDLFFQTFLTDQTDQTDQTDPSFARSMQFGLGLLVVMSLFNSRNKPITLEINDHNIYHEENTYGLEKLLTEPGPRYYVVGYHLVRSLMQDTIARARYFGCTVKKLSLKLTNHPTRRDSSALYVLGGHIRQYLRGEYDVFDADMALHLAIGLGGVTKHSLDYDPESHSLSIYGLDLWHELTWSQLDARNASAAMIEEIIIGGQPWSQKWLPTITITNLELSDCSIPLSHDFCTRFLPLISDNLQSITIRDTCLETENAWSAVIDLFASFDNLQHCCLVNLTSATFLQSLQGLFEGPEVAEFVDVVSWEHKGPGLKKGLWDLAARLTVAEFTWSELSDDDDMKWRSDLGAHLVKDINEEEATTTD